MAVPVVEWRYVGSTAHSTTIDSMLDSIYSLGTSSTYYDGSTRTPGSGSAGTYSRFQDSGTTEAVHAVPPTTTALAQKWIWAGSASAKSPTMASPDSYSASYLLVSINKGSGNYNAWDDPAPFTSGNFFGFWKGGYIAGASSSGNTHMWECEEAVMVAIANSSGSIKWHCLGAYVNPVSTAAADSEADERLYGVATSGSTANVIYISGNPANNASWMGNGTSNGLAHSGVFDPGAGTIVAIQRNRQCNPSNTYTGVSRSGSYLYCKNSIVMCQDSTPQNAMGVLREMSFFNRGTTGQVLSSGGADIAYVFAGSATSAHEAALLFRNA